MRKSISGSFLFPRSRKGGGAYESDLNMAGKQSTKSKNQSKPKEEIIMSKKRSIKVVNTQMYIDGYQVKLVSDTSYGSLWEVSFSLKEF